MSLGGAPVILCRVQSRLQIVVILIGESRVALAINDRHIRHLLRDSQILFLLVQKERCCNQLLVKLLDFFNHINIHSIFLGRVHASLIINCDCTRFLVDFSELLGKCLQMRTLVELAAIRGRHVSRLRLELSLGNCLVAILVRQFVEIEGREIERLRCTLFRTLLVSSRSMRCQLGLGFVALLALLHY